MKFSWPMALKEQGGRGENHEINLGGMGSAASLAYRVGEEGGGGSPGSLRLTVTSDKYTIHIFDLPSLSPSSFLTMTVSPLLGAGIPHLPHGGFVFEFHSAVHRVKCTETRQGIIADTESALQRTQQMPLSLGPSCRECSAEHQITTLMNTHNELANRLCQVFAGRPQGLTNEKGQQLRRANIWGVLKRD